MSSPRGLWPLGLIEEVNTSGDGLVWSVRIRTAKTELIRPVTKAVLLEGACDSESSDYQFYR